MKVLQIYNQYRSLFGGEETVVHSIADLVEQNGGEARLLMRSSRRLDQTMSGRAGAFLSGIFNPGACREVHRVVAEYRPDIVHVHNLNPMFSAWVLVTLRRAGVPVVMTVHNQYHTCPTADHFLHGEICERCVGGRDYNCVLQNCRGSLPESIGYALRSTMARSLGLYTRNVTAVIALNEFAKSRLVGAGFEAERVFVLPNMVHVPRSSVDASGGEFAVFSGRMCPEKGVDTLLEAVRGLPDLPLRLLGDGPTLVDHNASAPPNATFLGQLSADEVAETYRRSRFLVVPSRWFEGCPLVILEAMSHGLPVIASRIGGLPELVEDGVTGLLFEPGNPDDLASKMMRLWEDRELCRLMGREGRVRASTLYNADDHWDRLKSIYEAAIRMVNRAVAT